LPHYCAVNVASADDVRDALSLFALGEPRVLIDASSRDGIGGTGVRVDGSLVRDFSSSHKLWLAGGISPSNVRSVVAEFSPELVDVSSSLESAPGIKDEGKMREFFSNLG
ncbi:phosphoribosylanthranilate isomerase, partial [Treponema saccharophilum]